MKSILISAIALIGAITIGQAQQLPNWRPYDKNGLNMFEPPKDTATTFKDVRVKVGGAFALQYQALDHENNATPVLVNNVNTTELIAIGNNFNLATANLDLDVELYDGVNLHLRTYLSSRHHPEPYVKGGYIQIDKLNFIRQGFLAETMKYMTIKIGHMENNYGDAHFRRSDNALALYNPFVGNYIMDAFTTEVGAEVYYQRNGWLAMVGATNGKLNQGANNPGKTSPSTMLKLGYDKQINDDFRFRLTGSLYHTAHSQRTYLYGGDRAGSRYYFVMENTTATSKDNYSSGLIVPGFTNELTAIMINPFIRYKGIEFFGLVEKTSGKATAETDTRDFTQIGAELLYRFGKNENLYVGGRYNNVTGETRAGEDVDVTRFNFGGGWFMTKNILAKIEYVNQKYDGYNANNILHDGKFNGFVFEAVISF
ncbi:porin [Flavobacterium sp.]|uniref:porin n=1 Tax=Flavobacterium sp. TaxID=239 RepID=UPI002FDA9706